MTTLIAAYLLVWFGVMLYVTWLGARQRNIEWRLETLRTYLESANDTSSRAA